MLSIRENGLICQKRRLGLCVPGDKPRHECWAFGKLFLSDVWDTRQLTSTKANQHPAELCEAANYGLRDIFQTTKHCVREIVFGTRVSLNPIGLVFCFFGSCCATLLDLLAFKVTNMGMKMYVCFLCFRVVYLQVSMNEGLSFITSSVHITTTECVSLNSHHYNRVCKSEFTSLQPSV